MRFSALGLGAAVRAGRLTAVDAVMDALAAIATLNPVLRFATATHAGPAWMAAHAVDALEPGARGRLAGVPLLVKAGTPAQSPLVARLVGAGAVPIGEGARPRGGSTVKTWGWTEGGTTRNPWDVQRSPGGSSAGAGAAVGAGVVPLATGGDSGGSLRVPAAYSGAVGFKGTAGRVPRATGRARAALGVPGVVGATVADVAVATSIASGLCPADPTALPHWPAPELESSAPLRVAWSPDLGFAADVDPGVADVVSGVVDVLAEAGMVQPLDVPVRLADPHAAWSALYGWERGARVDGDALAMAHRLRRHNDAVLAELFERVDVLVTPTTPTTAHGHDRAGDRCNVDLCWAFNLSGNPAVSVPAGLHGGLPVGLQAVAAPHRDDAALRLAAMAEAAVTLPAPAVFWRTGLPIDAAAG